MGLACRRGRYAETAVAAESGNGFQVCRPKFVRRDKDRDAVEPSARVVQAVAQVKATASAAIKMGGKNGKPRCLRRRRRTVSKMAPGDLKGTLSDAMASDARAASGSSDKCAIIAQASTNISHRSPWRQRHHGKAAFVSRHSSTRHASAAAAPRFRAEFQHGCGGRSPRALR